MTAFAAALVAALLSVALWLAGEPMHQTHAIAERTQQ